MKHYFQREYLVSLTLLACILGVGAVIAEGSRGSDYPCPAGMVCLDGLIVPDVGPLPISGPIAGWNVNFGDIPIPTSHEAVVGEIRSVETERGSGIFENSYFAVYKIEDLYMQSHIRRIELMEEPDDNEDKEKIRKYKEHRENIERLTEGKRVIAKLDPTNEEVAKLKLNLATIRPLHLGEKEELGRIMFCDNRLSRDKLYGCATCHLPHHGFADKVPKSLGFDGQSGDRNSPSLFNVAFSTSLFWDGRAVTLEEQALQPLQHPQEMGMTARELIDRLKETREIDLVNIEVPRRPGGAAHRFTVGVIPNCPTKEELFIMPPDGLPHTVLVQGKDLDEQDWKAWKLPPRTRGALICHVKSGSTTLAAGLRRGNVIQRVNDKIVQSATDFEQIVSTELDTMDPDEPLRLKAYAQGKPYKEHFREVFGMDINYQAIAEALSAFERTITAGNSPFDRYMISGHRVDGFEDAEERGLFLFKGKARCILCHNGPNFTDGQFHNVGYPENESGVYQLGDLGRYVVDRNWRSKGAFKTPTLRGISLTWPYMHDGGIPKNFQYLSPKQKLDNGLREVVEFFNRGGGTNNPYADPLMKPLGLTVQEMEYLIAFLKALEPKPISIENCPFNEILSDATPSNGTG